jgi:hypothetical protein
VVKLKALEAFAAAADGKATKIIIPSEIQGLAGLATPSRSWSRANDPIRKYRRRARRALLFIPGAQTAGMKTAVF